jgi:hypothetical protein
MHDVMSQNRVSLPSLVMRDVTECVLLTSLWLLQVAVVDGHLVAIKAINKRSIELSTAVIKEINLVRLCLGLNLNLIFYSRALALRVYAMTRTQFFF